MYEATFSAFMLPPYRIGVIPKPSTHTANGAITLLASLGSQLCPVPIAQIGS